MKKILFSILIGMSSIYAQDINLQIPQIKIKQIKKAQNLYQYLYDLKKLDEILKLVYKDEGFKKATYTAENNIKNMRSKYSYEYIEMLLKVLEGYNEYNDIIGYYDKRKNIGGGYIKYISDKYRYDYEMFLIGFKNKNIIKNFDFMKDKIKIQLSLLNQNLSSSNNIKTNLRVIFHYLLLALNEINLETKALKKMHIIKSFNRLEDKKYLMPMNLAQIDGHTTLSDIVNFVVNGDKDILGIYYYYKKFYNTLGKYSIVY